MGLRILALSWGLSIALGAAGCARRPDAEWKAARAEVEAARASQRFTQDGVVRFRKAEEALKGAEVEMEARKGTSPSYSKAGKLLAEATEIATKLRADGESRARSLAEEAIPKLEKALPEVRLRLKRGDAFTRTPTDRGQFDQQIFALLHRESSGGKEGMEIKLKELDSLLDAARKALASRDYVKAIESAETVRDELERYYPGIVEP